MCSRWLARTGVDLGCGDGLWDVSIELGGCLGDLNSARRCCSSDDISSERRREGGREGGGKGGIKCTHK